MGIPPLCILLLIRIVYGQIMKKLCVAGKRMLNSANIIPVFPKKVTKKNGKVR